MSKRVTHANALLFICTFMSIRVQFIFLWNVSRHGTGLWKCPIFEVSKENRWSKLQLPTHFHARLSAIPGAFFSKAPETFRARKAIAKSGTLRLQSCFIHIFLIWTEVPFIQEVSGTYTSPYLDTDELKMVLPAEKFTGRSRKGAHDWICNISRNKTWNVFAAAWQVHSVV